MKIEKYICDRCRKPISVSKKQENFPYFLGRLNEDPCGFGLDKKIDLCEDCCNSFKKWLGEEE